MEELKINVEDSYCHVIKFGTGKRTLLILPGVSLCNFEGQGESIAKAYDIFSDDFTCYMINYRNKVHEGFSFKDISEDIYNVCVELDIEHAYIYGVSMGGMVGLYTAQKNNGYVDKLCVCSSMCKITQTMAEVGDKWIKYSKAHDVVGLNNYFFDRVYSKQYLKPMKDMLPELAKRGTVQDCDRFTIFCEAIINFDIKKIIKGIQTKTLVLGDKNDMVIGPEGSYEIADLLGCDIFMYDKYSHAVYDECPDIKKRIYDFMMKD